MKRLGAKRILRQTGRKVRRQLGRLAGSYDDFMEACWLGDHLLEEYSEDLRRAYPQFGRTLDRFLRRRVGKRGLWSFRPVSALIGGTLVGWYLRGRLRSEQSGRGREPSRSEKEAA